MALLASVAAVLIPASPRGPRHDHGLAGGVEYV
jgi:hypothetical protein